MNYLIPFFIFLLVSCEQSSLKIKLFQTQESIQHLNALQNQAISGGMKNQSPEIGDYSCKYSYSSQSNLSCDNLDNFSFDISNGNFSWTPNYQSQGSYHLVLISPSGKQSKIVVEVKKTNVAPSIVIVTAPNSFTENSSYQFILDASDINGDTLHYSFECASNNCDKLKNISLDQETKTFSFETDFQSAGNYSLVFKVSDGTSNDSINANFSVSDINRAPVLMDIGNQIVNEGELLSITALGLDADGNALTYSYSCSPSCPAGMSMTDNVFSWSPNFSQSGNYSVSFNVLDNGSPVLNDSETITITVNNVNAPPVLALIANQTIDELIAIATIDANDGGDDFDADAEAITYSCYYDTTVDGNVATSTLCTSLSGLTFNTTTGVMNWTPSLESANHYEFNIRGSDGSLIGNQIFTIKVNPSYPLILTYRTAIGNESVLLPSTNGFNYNYSVDWGDGSSIQKFTTANTQGHAYVSAGDHVVKIYGQFPAISFVSLSPANRNQLIEVNDLGKTGLVNLSSAFAYCKFLTKFEVGNGDTSNVTIMTAMFRESSALTSLDLSRLDTANVISFGTMFYEATGLKSLNLSNFDTKKVTDMGAMFYGASGLTSLDLSSFETPSLTYMSSMFSGASGLESLDISNFDTSKVGEMWAIFSGLSKLKSLDLSNFDTSSATYMANMFEGNSSLTTLDLSRFDTSKVVGMRYMFDGCSKITNLNVSSFNTENVTDMSYMFNRMSSLESLDLSSFNTAKVTNMNYMIYQNSNLLSLDLTGWILRDPLPTRTNMLGYSPGNRVTYCAQNPIGNNLGITCTP